ncbi:DUF1684 domain-containing protein [Deinococcus sp. HMF7620]|uniref:DUF1684 domain-containing protein n=1 Tax=Deinococcus arboris TaxID=2682977 RepID=A0A7C9I3C8_9DEIO|nr:DUF1684 domain-containing protein [Deinococcus arboris]MVN87311.1 DUF1684 domain-containing protein [Deinococcus arboris]
MVSVTAYADALLDFRRRKDEHFAAGNGPVNTGTFRGLSYFAPDEAWAFTLPLTRLPQDASAEFPLETNTGEVRVMARYGEVTVPLPGGQHTLLVFTPLGEEVPARVFLPFRDTTSGAETYGAGRYLDAPLDQQLGGDGPLIRVDFNLAYHPYCAYSPQWTCPLPPRENWLSEAVPVGEKL